MLPELVDISIAEGKRNAELIDWVTSADLFGSVYRDPESAILASREEFESVGWKWSAVDQCLQKGGWYAFYRSQGRLSPPILQWQRMPGPAA